jgi:hypothetical protein
MLTHNLGSEALETFINLLKCILLDQDIKVEMNIPYHMLNIQKLLEFISCEG